MSLNVKSKLSTKLLGSDSSKGSPFGSSRSSFGTGEGYSSHLNFRCVLITFCLAAIIYEVCWVISFLVGWISASDQIMTMDSFTSSGSKKDLTNISWVHAVNSKEKLDQAFIGSAQMLEADVSMGRTAEQSDEESGEVPIMAHPPATTSDLSFNDFIAAVIKHNKNGSATKGIKLDFKQIDCVEPVLRKLRDKKKSINFHVWLNADVLRGPVNATRIPINGKDFLTLANKYFPQATLSLGWTTRFGTDDEKQEPSKDGSKKTKIVSGHYTKAHVDEMVKLLDALNVDGTTTAVTFPVRAAIASQSVDTLVDLLRRAGSKSSLTLWAPIDDPVDPTKLNYLINKVGKDKVYCDLPYIIAPTDNNSKPIHVFPDTTVSPHLPDSKPRKNHTNPDNGKNEGSAPKGLTGGLTLVSLLITLFSAFRL